jgi:hypothetical protein
MNITPLPGPLNDGTHETAPQHPSNAHAWWKEFSNEHGWLGRRIHDVRMAPAHGWSRMALWVKAVIIVGGCLLGLLALRVIPQVLLDWAQLLPWKVPTADDSTGLLATIDQPVRSYLETHTATLPITATTAYSTWQAVGVISFLLGFLRSGGAHLTWTIWGAATVAMVWSSTPEPGRQVAAGVAVLAWAALSILALRGVSLAPASFVRVDVHAPVPPAPEVRAEIYLPKPDPTSYTPYDSARQQPPSLN